MGLAEQGNTQEAWDKFRDLLPKYCRQLPLMSRRGPGVKMLLRATIPRASEQDLAHLALTCLWRHLVSIASQPLQGWWAF